MDEIRELDNRWIDFSSTDWHFLKDNLQNFVHNFSNMKIIKGDTSGYYVYVENMDSPITYCPTREYLNGWLWGVVQGAKRKEFKNE